MARKGIRIDMMGIMRQLLRYGITGVAAYFVLFLVTGIFASIGTITVGGGIIVAILTLTLYLTALKIRPGKENILTDVIPVLIAAGAVTSIAAIVGLTLPMVSIPVTIGIDFGIAVASVFIADTLLINIFPALKELK